MYGRNGTDTLCWVQLGVGIVISLISKKVPWTALFDAIGLALVIWSLFRMYSKNLEHRRKENAAFVNFFRQMRDRSSRYFICPQCARTVRVPKGKGKIKIHCPQCGSQFIKKT